ncbi:MAG: tetraacyldisaccharide 4'-kinase [Candidatus Amulumruptor caecigallinarius]|nr:tetraacyldisaccharide 4'-kinase [Candidatus Amulumruptor caecigallinarius]
MRISELSHKILPYVLKPLSWAYGAVVDVRNWMFDHGVLNQEEFDVPVISVGNITVGGTGKTPHVEYLAGLLALDYNIAILSRGYKRKTKGFILANKHSNPDTIGDEPMQLYNKLGNHVKVAVCEKRSAGIKHLLRLYPDLQLIILDDAFQHRYVKPKVNILLMDYTRPIYEDKILPLGRLRESAHSANRADMVIITKCPQNLAPLSYRLVSNRLALMPYQKLYFSTLSYGEPTPVFPDDKPFHVSLHNLTSRDTVLVMTGIANPRGFVRHFKSYPFKVIVDHYPDHHDFTREDLKRMEEKVQSMPGERKLILTTEKDAVRLAYNPYFPNSLKQFIFYIPVSVKMLPAIDGGNIIDNLNKAMNAQAL